MAARADRQLLGSDDDKDSKDALLPALRASAAQLDGLLADTRARLGRGDAVLHDAQVIGANARKATTELGALRAEVESTLSKLEGLINQIGRQWPFARD